MPVKLLSATTVHTGQENRKRFCPVALRLIRNLSARVRVLIHNKQEMNQMIELLGGGREWQGTDVRSGGAVHAQ